jgi:catechol 2,3-dioxygenase-like lactoylglutathione lyase family enzyme
MTIQRMDHVSVVVDDLEAARAFFLELGMEPEGEGTIEDRGSTVSMRSMTSGSRSR